MASISDEVASSSNTKISFPFLRGCSEDDLNSQFMFSFLSATVL